MRRWEVNALRFIGILNSVWFIREIKWRWLCVHEALYVTLTDDAVVFLYLGWPDNRLDPNPWWVVTEMYSDGACNIISLAERVGTKIPRLPDAVIEHMLRNGFKTDAYGQPWSDA